MVGSIAALPDQVQIVVFIAVPASLVYLLRTTIRHAQSFHDAIRRIAAIEVTINKRCGQALLTFQSTHPGRNKVGGRTAFETVEAVAAVSAILLSVCGYLFIQLGAGEELSATLYLVFLACIAAGLLTLRCFGHRYRYRPRPA